MHPSRRAEELLTKGTYRSAGMTRQELFDRWYQAERGCINEWSGDIASDMRKLHAEATAYAKSHNLAFVIELDEWHKEI